jgi:hypothetical protein
MKGDIKAMFNSSSVRRGSLILTIAVGFSAIAFAQEGMRKWRDQTGKFEVEAKLLGQAEGKVQLLKNDGRAVWVPLAALSDADQQYVKSLPKADADPFAGGVPLNESAVPPEGAPAVVSTPATGTAAEGSTEDPFSRRYDAKVLPSDGAAIFINVDEPIRPLEPDADAFVPKFQSMARPFTAIDAYGRVSPPILIDPQGPVFAVSAHRHANASNPSTFGRVYLISEGEKQPKPVLDLEAPLLLLDHHVASGHSLATIGMEKSLDMGGDLLLLNGLAAGKPEVVARWRLPGWDKPGFKPRVYFARLLDEHRALVQVDYTVHVWDLAQGKSLLKIDRLTASGKIRISGTGKYLAVPVSKGCKLIDLVKGELVGRVPFPGLLTPEVRFSPNGQRLAMVAGNQFVVWDLTTAAISAEATLGVPCGEFYGWIGERYLLTQLGGLIDPELGMTLWSYSLPPEKGALTMPGGVVTVSKRDVATLMCLPVPHGAVERVTKRLADDDGTLLLVRPGTEVSLAIEAIEGADQAAILAALQTNVERAGWKVKPDAPIRVIAKVGRGGLQKIYFTEIGRLSIGPYRTAEITPYVGSLTIQRGDDVLWSSSAGNMIPVTIQIERGQTVEQAKQKWEIADPPYFERLAIPARILRPEVRMSIGRSRIDEGAWVDY